MIYDLQKASMWKRISAYLFDGILLSIVAVLFAYILSIILHFNTYNDALHEAYTRYENEYQVDFSMSLKEFESMTAEESSNMEKAYEALNADENAMYAYGMMINLTLLITSIGILLAFLVLEFAVPLFFGNGQTLGKKVFGIALMRTEGIKINAVSLFIRTVLGKYTIETMIPVLILMMIYFNVIGLVGTIVLLLILLVQVILLITSRTNALIHDVLATTVAVDLASQMIFDTKEDLIAYRKKVHAQQVAQQRYQ